MDCRVAPGNDEYQGSSLARPAFASAMLIGQEAAMFERDEVFQDLHGGLVAAGINPLDPKVQTICEVVNAFYAEKTREVLEKMQAVLNKIPT
jgi:hypothetical protein